MSGAPDILFFSECIAKSTFSSAKQQDFIKICDPIFFQMLHGLGSVKFLLFILLGVAHFCRLKWQTREFFYLSLKKSPSVFVELSISM